MTTVAVRILNPKAKNILDDLASVGLIEVGPFSSAIDEFQNGMKGVAEQYGIRDEDDVARIVNEIRRDMQSESAHSLWK